MRPFPLKIVTPDGIVFEGQIESLTVRTSSGDLGILAGHINLVAPLGQGQCNIVIDGNRRKGFCSAGMLTVLNGQAAIITARFIWNE